MKTLRLAVLNYVALPILILASGSAAFAQSNVQHIIIAIQENRSLDNLFGSDLTNPNGRQLPNAHLAPTNATYPGGYGLCGTQQIGLMPANLDSCWDIGHTHEDWLPAWNSGAMNGACNGSVNLPQGCLYSGPMCNGSPCPQYSYADNSTGQVAQYFQIAQQFGFANYMLQTNQGPSMPAHEFLFSGTSAPDEYPISYYDWFAEDNPFETFYGGCSAPAGTTAQEIGPSGNTGPGYSPPEPTPGSDAGFPCYNHPTLANLLDNAGVTWNYYADNGEFGGVGPGQDYWTAPNSFYNICGQVVNGLCTGSEFTKHVVLPLDPTRGGYTEPILWDLGFNGNGGENGVCQLPNVSWVIPDGNWSDHPGASQAGGPSWIAALINAVGGVKNNGEPLPTQCNYWSNTVILVVWDDWGGFYDDVNPDPNGPGYSNQTGQQYVYGFRVPLLVVSQYAMPGYVSGPQSGATCPNYYCHDFGSILNFIEYTFGLGTINGNATSPDPYADALVRDVAPPTYPYSLSDFFGTTPHSFNYIANSPYATRCFTDETDTQGCFPGYPEVPDNDAADSN